MAVEFLAAANIQCPRRCRVIKVKRASDATIHRSNGCDENAPIHSSDVKHTWLAWIMPWC